MVIRVETLHGVREFRSVDQAIEYGKRAITTSPARWARIHNALIAGTSVTIANASAKVTFRPARD